MFRIAFDWSTGNFVVQVKTFLGRWRTVCEEDSVGTTYRRFATYAAARAWVDMIGLADALREEGKPEQQKIFHIVEQVTEMKL
jgi:hypothetical protein